MNIATPVNNVEIFGITFTQFDIYKKNKTLRKITLKKIFFISITPYIENMKFNVKNEYVYIYFQLFYTDEQSKLSTMK